MPTADFISVALSHHGLRQTPVRRAVLRALQTAPYALSSHDLEQQLGPDTDRITLYRTLRTFEQKGVIHRVVGTTDIIHYAACAPAACTEHAHTDDHVHFKCTACQQTYCLDQVPVPDVALPGGFRATTRDYLLSGVCQRCQPA